MIFEKVSFNFLLYVNILKFIFNFGLKLSFFGYTNSEKTHSYTVDLGFIRTEL